MEIPFEGKLSKDTLKTLFKLIKYSPNTISGWIFIKCFAIAVALLIVFLGTEKIKFYAFLLISISLLDIWSLFKSKCDVMNDVYDRSTKEVKGTVSEQCFKYFAEGIKTEEEWENFHCHKTTDSLVIIYDKKKSYRAFHKPWFQSDSDWNDFLELVKTKTSLKES